MTTTDPLDVLQAALDEATAGPWQYDRTYVEAEQGVITDCWEDAADAAAIVALRNAAPDLLAAIRNVRALAEAWKQSSPTGLSALAGAARELRAALGSFGGQQ